MAYFVPNVWSFRIRPGSGRARLLYQLDLQPELAPHPGFFSLCFLILSFKRPMNNPGSEATGT